MTDSINALACTKGYLILLNTVQKSRCKNKWTKKICCGNSECIEM